MAAFWCTFLSLLAVASISFICGCTLSVVLCYCCCPLSLHVWEHDERVADKRTPKHGRFYLFYFAAMYESLFLLQCISWDVFVVLQHLFSTTSKRTWPREISHVRVPGLSATALPNRTAGRERLQAGMVTVREGVIGRNPLIPGVEKISSRIGSWANERGLKRFFFFVSLCTNYILVLNFVRW